MSKPSSAFKLAGIGKQYAELLAAAGVDTMMELAQRNPQNLLRALAETNKELRLVRKLPTESQVREWVKQSQKISRAVTY